MWRVTVIHVEVRYPLMSEDEPPRSANVSPGYDEEDPHEGVDLTSYPEWWRRNVEEFRAHEMRPYRPPRFADETVTTEVIDHLESELGVTIRIRVVDTHIGGEWKVFVDGDPVQSIERIRSEAGNSRYEITSEAFKELVRDAVEK